MLKSSSRLAILALATAALLFGLATRGHGQTLRLNEIKANYLEGFLDYVRWDGELIEKQAVIGIIGSNDVVRRLEAYAAEKETGRALKIVALKPGDPIDQLDILFVASGNRPHWKTFVQSSQKEKVLLVGEEEGFLESGGVIEFVFRRNRLRFAIDRENAQRCGIDVSSRLLEIAVGNP